MNSIVRPNYNEWLRLHCADPELFDKTISQYICSDEAWDTIAKYEYDKISKHLSYNFWNTVQPLTQGVVRDSFMKWADTSVFAPAENSYGPYLFERILPAHNRLNLCDLITIGNASLSSYTLKVREKQYKAHLLSWLPLLSEKRAVNENGLREKLSLIATLFETVDHKALDVALSSNNFWCDEAAPSAIFAHLCPETQELSKLYNSLDLGFSDISSALRSFRTHTTTDTKVSLTVDDLSI